jgi:hypothetical protein
MREILLDALPEERNLLRPQQPAQHHGTVGLERVDVRLS